MQAKPQQHRVFITVRSGQSKERHETSVYLESNETVRQLADGIAAGLMERFKVKTEFRDRTPKPKSEKKK